MQVKVSGFETQQKPIKNYCKLGCGIFSSTGLAAVLIGLGTVSASAEITPFQIQSTGTISGTIELPSFNPNFNNSVTRVDTDSTGTYNRNIGSNTNPNYVLVYKSDYVKVETRADGSLHYFVDFKGIPVVSFDGILNSPVLSDGELTPYTYQGKLPGTKYQGVVQDEFGLTKAFYTGIVTDPTTGQQYEGTFQVSGQGPRYSDRNGGKSPTVFDFKSDLPGKPTVTSYKMTNSPLVRLTINVPADAKLVTPPTTGAGSSTPPTPLTLPQLLPLSPPPHHPISPLPPPPQLPPLPPLPPLSPSPHLPISPSSHLLHLLISPTPTSDIEFSSGNFIAVNSPVFNSASMCVQDSKNCRTKVKLTPKKAIGPRSRVLLR
ncbi:hypothetical protein [Fischerella sp. JS2]|uniref:hypothetical protein n=1 Tax=Fischerella sp. JS2 TaxID=2597771 RepID=UPI0028F138A3|nr:hypothetical protein [Fischerella sp. JS2]